MRTWEDGDTLRMHFDSVHELSQYAATSTHLDRSVSKRWEGVDSVEEAFELARDGWSAELNRAIQVAEDAVTKVERDYTMPSFVATHDVAGCEVDVARYLDGTPENMIDYPLTEIVKSGRVITLVAPIVVSASISPEVLARRGQVVVALAIALSRLGYSLEVWADYTVGGGLFGNGDGRRVELRTLVKGPTDPLDPAGLMFALAHPAMLRVLSFPAMKTLQHRKGRFAGVVSVGLGPIAQPVRNMPDGTLYLTPLKSAHDVPDADEQLVEWLKELELITDEN